VAIATFKHKERVMSMQGGTIDEHDGSDTTGKLMDKASSFFKGISSSDRFQKVQSWVKSNPKMAAGIGVVLGSMLLRGLRKR
jgi:hypothetical protein